MKALLASAFLLAAISVGAKEDETGHAHHAVADPMTWTTYPLIEETSAPMRNRAVFAVRNLAVESARIYPPTGQGRLPEGFSIRGSDKPYDVLLEQGRFALTPAGRGNYYWAVARSESAGEVRIASSARYFTNPGPAPTAMLALPKYELEIVPDPLPREHWQYREGERWEFLLRYRGRPLPGTPVRLLSEHGSSRSFVTDARGIAEVIFPQDLPRTPPASGGRHHARQSSGFVLVAEHEDAGTRYLTAFNYRYSAAPLRDRSLMAGAGFMLLGGLLATPLLRRTRGKRKRNHHA